MMANVTVDPGQAVDGRTEERFYTDLQHCIDQRFACDIAYQSSVEPTKIAFKRPAHFKVTHKLGLAWRLNPEGKEYDIEIEFAPMVATNVAEVRWHSTQKVKRLADGSCLLSFRVDGLREIAWWVCGYADQARVRKPAALRKLVREMHTRAAAMNDE